ncbi:MAG: hypothetical protein RL226_388 [Bacteroidota bacterium]
MKYNGLKVAAAFAVVITMVWISCGSTEKQDLTKDYSSPNDQFKSYWYNGLGEVNTYALSQARYGELRTGEAVVVFVTEPFDTEKHVKSDREDANDVRVMKINHVKKFLTGVYPYSVMTSAFTPINASSYEHPLKATSTAQEWCGHAFLQLNNRDKHWKVQQNSYFEMEGDREFSLDECILEDGLWTALRIDPEKLPQGKHQVIPGLTYLRFSHNEVKSYEAELTLVSNDDEYVYSVFYPALGRTLRLYAGKDFPHPLTRWEETYVDGWNASAKELTSTGTLIHSEQLPYWELNNNADSVYRTRIGLKH